jgi:hypothetical protein
MPKPTRTEILDVIADIEAGAWIDPCGDELMFHWCNLFSPKGVFVGDGVGFTPGEAMAYAWIHAHSPDALMSRGTTPYTASIEGFGAGRQSAERFTQLNVLLSAFF